MPRSKKKPADVVVILPCREAGITMYISAKQVALLAFWPNGMPRALETHSTKRALEELKRIQAERAATTDSGVSNG